MNTKKDIKLQANVLLERLRHLGVNIKSTQALEAVSALLDSSDWNRLNAKIGRLDTSSGLLFQPKEHKILVTPPGYGKTRTLMNIFKREVEEGIRIPVYVTFRTARGVLRYWEQTSDIMSKCQVVTLEQGFTVNPVIDSDSKGVIFVLMPNDGEPGDLILSELINRLEFIIKTNFRMKIGTFMIDEFHQSVVSVNIEKTKCRASVRSNLAALSRAISQYQGMGSIERLIISTQTPIDNSAFDGFCHPIKTLKFGVSHGYLDGSERKGVPHEIFLSYPTLDLFSCPDRYVEDIFWHTCAVGGRKNKDSYNSWYAQQVRSHINPEAKSIIPGSNPIIDWLDAENQRGMDYDNWLRNWAKADQ